jgi:predicted  nucleic acid-binding Zn-ribbon protein
MREALKVILSIQELDIKMIRLMRLKKQRQDELKQIAILKQELLEQLDNKQDEIADLSEECLLYERKIEEHKEKIKKLEGQQTSIKKIEEFNAITKEISSLEREKGSFEQTLSNLVDKKAVEEEVYEKTKKSLADSDLSNKTLEEEIKETIQEINKEGSGLKKTRDEQVKTADPQIFSIYERLLRNKKDRVVVPIENRTCTGCHIALTAQHENLVRKGEKLVFCEHCSRIHFWNEGKEESIDGSLSGVKRRRRRVSSAGSAVAVDDGETE